MTSTGYSSIHDPVLWDAQGSAISLEGALIAPNALNFANIIRLPGRVYPFGWDEAMRQAPEDALAMRRDAFYRGLMQERTSKTINREWQVVCENDGDPIQVMERDTMARCWRQTPDKIGLITWLEEAIWFGRSAQQLQWGKQDGGLIGVTFHEPVHGDSVQFAWDNVPVVLVSQYTAQKYQQLDPDAIVSATDRGSYGLRLYKPEYRNRFIIHKHVREAADYFEGEMSGGVHGVGLRSWCYWSGFMKRETMAWMTNFMQSTGMMDLLLFNYPDGNAQAKAKAEENAKKITGKIALLSPYNPALERKPAVEQIPMNAAGVQVLKELVESYYDRHIERLFVGQSMSAGGGASGGLEGSGRAEFAADTKEEIQLTDANRLGETLSQDWLRHAYRFNFPAGKSILRMEPVLDDPQAETKIKNFQTLNSAGIAIEEDEVIEAAGFRVPRPGRKLTKPQMPQADPGDKSASDLPNDSDSPDYGQFFAWDVTHYADAAGHEHAPAGSPDGGQFTGKTRTRGGKETHYAGGKRVADDDREGRAKAESASGTAFNSIGRMPHQSALDIATFAKPRLRNALGAFRVGKVDHTKAYDHVTATIDQSHAAVKNRVERAFAVLRADFAKRFGEDALSSPEWRAVEQHADDHTSQMSDAIESARENAVDALDAYQAGEKNRADVLAGAAEDYMQGIAHVGDDYMKGLTPLIGAFKAKHPERTTESDDPWGDVAVTYFDRDVTFYRADAVGHEHKDKGPGGGQFTAKGKSGNVRPLKSKAAPVKSGVTVKDTSVTFSVKPTKARAFTGEPVVLKTTISKQDTGKIGEAIVVAWLKSKGMADAGAMNIDRNNFPIDLIQDHETIEAKTGLASNSKSAQQWRLTIGQPGNEESAWLAAASPEEKAAWNARKQKEIHARKQAVLDALGKEVGHKIKAVTITVILNPDTKTADIYKFSGWHDRIAWGSAEAKAGYVESVTYA